MSAISGEVLTFDQTNGPDVRLKVFGDELYARYEDLNGYSVVYDAELGQFCYARIAAGTFRSTGVPLGEAEANQRGKTPSLAIAHGISPCSRIQPLSAPNALIELRAR